MDTDLQFADEGCGGGFADEGCADVKYIIPSGEGCADLKEGQGQGPKLEDANPLKRSFDSDFEDEEEEEEKEDSDFEEEEPVKQAKNKPKKSELHSILSEKSIERMASKFIKDSALVKLLYDVLNYLKKKVIVPSDVELFFDAVSRVLDYKYFIEEFYKESASIECESYFFLFDVRAFAVQTQNRVDKIGKTEELMLVIKKDCYFDEAFEVEDLDLVIRGVLGILIVYCISESDLERMVRKIGRAKPEVWVTKATPLFCRHYYD